ncbi:hypothetical protein [Promicromonospora sp. NPDC050262]|uniref:hypothetical protein n=1 Tax=Promicromonospora sp. NPDC050262 TaxID=3155036 RepID=UPI0033E34F86
MHKNFRRALYTALVTGGLVVVGAASAYAAGDGLPDPAQGAPETIEGAASPAAAPEGLAGDTAEGDAAVTPADDATELAPAGDAAESVVHTDISGVVEEVLDGTLGEDGLVDGLLEGLLPVETEVPGGEPGAGEPGTDEPGTDEPGTEAPGAGEPGTDEPGTPGTDQPNGPGTDQPGTDPGTDGPGILDPGILDPDAGDPDVVEPGAGEPGPGEPATGGPGRDTLGTGGSRPGHETELPGAHVPGIAHPTGDRSGTAAPGAFGAPGQAAPGSADAADADAADAAPSGDRVQDVDAEQAGVDISWGDKAVVVPTTNGGAILSGGPGAGYLIGTSTGLDGQVVPVDVPGETLAQTGPMITGQLALVSLLLGLGIVVLRMRRRRYVV